jgi:hypothetical protein
MMIEYIVVFIIAFIIGYSWAITQHISSVPYKELKDEDTIAGLRKEIEYYKDLCKWHAERKDTFFEEGRQQGMKQERALWNLTASSQEIGNE